MDRPFLLINSNTARPPVSPVGLEYVGEALQSAGIEVEVMDLCWEQDWHQALTTRLSRLEPLAVGHYLPQHRRLLLHQPPLLPPLAEGAGVRVKRQTSAPVILGGVGFSIRPGASYEIQRSRLRRCRGRGGSCYPSGSASPTRVRALLIYPTWFISTKGAWSATGVRP